VVGYLKEVAHLDRGDFACKHLSDTNECTIYCNRPPICDIEKVYKNKLSKHITKQEYFKIAAEACNKMQNMVGLGLKYRVIL
jgi:Fe-S-cluster containining protein